MTKRTVIAAYDDLHDKLDGSLVPADHVDVPLKFGDREVLLDLTGAHYAELERTLARLFEAGAAPEEPPRPAAKPRPPAKPRQEKKRKTPVAPFKEYTAGMSMAETSQWLAGLRRWADERGRTAEYRDKLDGTVRPDRKYYYPVRLLKDYVESLTSPGEQPEEQRAAG